MAAGAQKRTLPSFRNRDLGCLGSTVSSLHDCRSVLLSLWSVSSFVKWGYSLSHADGLRIGSHYISNAPGARLQLVLRPLAL